MRIRQYLHVGVLCVFGGVAGCAAFGQAPERRPIHAFARSEGLTDEIRVHTTYSLPEFDFREFRVNYRGPEGKEWFRIGVEVASRAGWTKPACWIHPRYGDVACPLDRVGASITFRPRATEAFLWGDPFLDRLAVDGRDRDWARLLLHDPELPEAALASLVARASYDDLLIDDPRVRRRVDWLVAIYDRNRRSGQVGKKAFAALWPHGVHLVAAPGTPRRLIMDLAEHVATDPSPDSLTAALAGVLLDHAGIGRDTAVLLRVAALSPEAGPVAVRLAGQGLLENPQVTTAMLRGVACNLAADFELEQALFHDPRIVDHPFALEALARCRWRHWRVAERARWILKQRFQSAPDAEIREPIGAALPMAIPDAWGDADPVFVGHWAALRHALWQLDPLAQRREAHARPRTPRHLLEAALCKRAADPKETQANLALMAEGAVYATSTRLAECLLENPAIGSHPGVLQLLATMLDVNHDPRLPPPDTPSIDTIRQQARATLRGVQED